MNGFIQFADKGGLEEFLASPQLAPIRASGKVVSSSSQPTLILKELSAEDFSEMKALAEMHGGKIKSSTQYETLAK
jgi:hypothetical protein